MPAISRLRCQHHFAITHQFQTSDAVAIVQDIDTPDLDTIGTDGDSGPQRDVIIPALELRLVGIKQYFLMLRRASDGLAGGRPERPTLAVLHIYPCAPRSEEHTSELQSQ